MRKGALICCEFSGEVRRAMRARGIEAWSCDLLESEDNSPYHIKGDAIAELCRGDYSLVIAFPPCTYLCNSGVRWLYHNGRDDVRWANMRQAAAFFLQFFDIWEGPVAVENPIMHKHASALIGDRAERQIIQPWMFGHGETKATVLWRRDLPELKPTNIVSGRNPRVHFSSPGPNRWKERSRTLPGIAAAIAEQWGNFV